MRQIQRATPSGGHEHRTTSPIDLDQACPSQLIQRYQLVPRLESALPSRGESTGDADVPPP